MLSVLGRQNKDRRFHPAQPRLPESAPIGFLCPRHPSTPHWLPDGVGDASLSTTAWIQAQVDWPSWPPHFKVELGEAKKPRTTTLYMGVQEPCARGIQEAWGGHLLTCAGSICVSAASMGPTRGHANWETRAGLNGLADPDPVLVQPSAPSLCSGAMPLLKTHCSLVLEPPRPPGQCSRWQKPPMYPPRGNVRSLAGHEIPVLHRHWPRATASCCCACCVIRFPQLCKLPRKAPFRKSPRKTNGARACVRDPRKWRH